MATWSTGLSLRGTAGAQLRYGTGTPGSTNPSTQADGDAYLDLATGNLYAVRTKGVWPSSPSTNIVGATGPASIVTVSAPPGPNVGVVGGYAVYNNSGIILLYGPKTSSGWSQTAADSQGNTYPVSVQLTGAKGDTGATGAASTVAGPKGDTGATGARGLQAWSGTGAFVAANYPNAQSGDLYFDTTSGAQALYTLS